MACVPGASGCSVDRVMHNSGIPFDDTGSRLSHLRQPEHRHQHRLRPADRDVYVDYCILTLKRYGDEMLLTKDRRTALELTMTKAGAAMFVSANTTAISFFSIVITRFDGLYELGIVSGIGVLICLFRPFS